MYVSSYSWLLIIQKSNKDKATIRIKHKICSRQPRFKFSNVNVYRFCSVEAVRQFEFWNVFDKCFYGVQLF